MTDDDIPMGEQLACAMRELALRRVKYPKLCAAGTMPVKDARREIARMAAIVETLDGLVAAMPERAAR